MAQYQKTTTIPCAAEELYRWHGRDGAFERLIPPWQSMDIVSRKGGIEKGANIHIRLKRLGISTDWVAQITDGLEGSFFVDSQLKGPFAEWIHRHEFSEVDSHQCRLTDSIDYSLPAGKLGALFGGRFVASDLERVFRYRHEITRSDLTAWNAFRTYPRFNVLISGGYGFIGSRLADFLKAQGHSVSVLSRNPRQGDVGWDPENGSIDSKDLNGFDAIIHLAGENLGASRWNEALKKQIHASRINSTKLLVDAMEKMDRPAKVFISGSAVGYYGDCGDRLVNEADGSGDGFLAEVCKDWEAEASLGSGFVDRVICLRTGIVLDAGDGALRKMLPPFKLGLGGSFGSGEQWMSWIALEDWIAAVHHLMLKGESGAYNLVSPNPERNKSFGKTLASVLRRPAFFNVPAPGLKAAIGEVADEGLLSSCRAEPKGLTDAGYRFLYPKLGDALKLVLGRI